MKELKLHLDGQPPVQIESDMVSGLEALRRLNVKDLGRVVAVKVNGELRDLSGPIARMPRWNRSM